MFETVLLFLQSKKSPNVDEILIGRFFARQDHCRTSHFDYEIGFFQGFLLNNHLLPSHYLGFDRSDRIVLINSKILITTGRIWPVSSDKWKAP